MTVASSLAVRRQRHALLLTVLALLAVPLLIAEPLIQLRSLKKGAVA